jgi:hypothetical protein
MAMSEEEIELLLIKFGAKLFTDEKGQQMFEFSHFDLDSFRKQGVECDQPP